MHLAPPAPVSLSPSTCRLEKRQGGEAWPAVVRHRKRRQQVHCYHLRGKVIKAHYYNQQETTQRRSRVAERGGGTSQKNINLCRSSARRPQRGASACRNKSMGEAGDFFFLSTVSAPFCLRPLPSRFKVSAAFEEGANLLQGQLEQRKSHLPHFDSPAHRVAAW